MNYLKVNHLKWVEFTHFLKQKYQKKTDWRQRLIRNSRITNSELRNGPTKTHTDLHNGDFKYGFLLQWFCLLSSGVFSAGKKKKKIS